MAITFHYNKDRLKYLEKITSSLDVLADKVNLYVVTNTLNVKKIARINLAIKTKKFKVISYPSLTHPHYLTWAHFDIFQHEFVNNKGLSHFLYLEDDLQIKPNNIDYWLKARKELKSFELYPSFLRYENLDGEDEPRSTDIPKPLKFNKLPKVVLNSGYCYLNLPYPYQGMYLLDRALAKEYFSIEPLNKRRNYFGGVREHAASGLTFINVPTGFKTRNLVGFRLDNFRIDPDALIHHLPNNYANNPESDYGNVSVDELVFKKIDFKIILHEMKLLRRNYLKLLRKILRKISQEMQKSI